MSREKIGLFSKNNLISELKDCFDYFDRQSSKILGEENIILIHGNGITLRKVAKGRGYSVETAGVDRVVGVDTISKLEQAEMVRKIRNITIPYAEYKRWKQKKA